MSDHEIIDGRFYWVWMKRSTRREERPPALVVAQPWRDDRGKVCWEGCGTDEGISVIRVVCEAVPPETTAP